MEKLFDKKKIVAVATLYIFFILLIAFTIKFTDNFYSFVLCTTPVLSILLATIFSKNKVAKTYFTAVKLVIVWILLSSPFVILAEESRGALFSIDTREPIALLSGLASLVLIGIFYNRSK